MISSKQRYKSCQNLIKNSQWTQNGIFCCKSPLNVLFTSQVLQPTCSWKKWVRGTWLSLISWQQEPAKSNQMINWPTLNRQIQSVSQSWFLTFLVHFFCINLVTNWTSLVVYLCRAECARKVCVLILIPILDELNPQQPPQLQHIIIIISASAPDHQHHQHHQLTHFFSSHSARMGAKLQFMVWGSWGSRGSRGSRGSQGSQGSRGAPEGQLQMDSQRDCRR